MSAASGTATPVSSATPRSPETGLPEPSRLRPAAQRTGAGPIAWVGPVLALLLVLVGLVLLRDAFFAPPGATGWPGDQQSWLATATTAVDGVGRAPWVVAAGAVLVLVGLSLVVVSLRRRTRTVLALTGSSGAYLLPVDAARRARAAADAVDGVLGASASATRRRVVVEVTTVGGGRSATEGVRQQVVSAVEASLSALERVPAVRVRTSASSQGSGDLA